MATNQSKSTAGFAGLGDKLKGIGAAVAGQQGGKGRLAYVKIARIKILPQQRFESFDGSDSTIESLAGTIEQVGDILQPILLRPLHGDPDFDYVLVAGERRIRGLLAAGKDEVPAMIRDFTEEQVLDAQFLENIERQKLSLAETTRALERRMEALKNSGTSDDQVIPELLKKFGRADTLSNRSWLSNMMALRNMGEATQAATGLTTNMQTVASVARLERQDPVAAKAIVEAVKEQAKENPREAQKTLVQATNKAKADIREAKGKPPRKNAVKETPKGTTVATKPNDSHTLPGAAVTLPGLGNGLAMTKPRSFMDNDDQQDFGVGGDETEHDAIAATSNLAGPVDAENLFELVTDSAKGNEGKPGVRLLATLLEDVAAGSTPEDAIAMLNKADKDNVYDFLQPFFDAGKKTPNVAHVIITGLRRGVFGDTGVIGAQLSAFLHGTDGVSPRFSLLDIVGAMRPAKIDL